MRENKDIAEKVGEKSPVDSQSEFGTSPNPSTMPTGETVEEWKARHNAVIDRCLKHGTRKVVRRRLAAQQVNIGE